MNEWLLRIYDWMRVHRGWCLCLFLLLTLLLVLSVARLTYKEDIQDFLPLDDEQRQALDDSEQQAQTGRIVVFFDTETPDPDLLTEAVDSFVSAVRQMDTEQWLPDLSSQVDFSQMEEQQETLYRQMPLLLDADDYRRIDSLLQSDGYIASQLQQDRERLLLPAGGLFIDDIRRDPLNLFTPVMSQLRDTTMMSRFDLYDGCLLTADHRRALLLIDSPFGGSETASNARLLSLLESAAQKVTLCTVRLIGGPVIAVTNAMQIRQDSILSVSLAVVLILLLLWCSIRNVRNILLIAVTIAWGWLFAMGCLAVVHREVSIIVIGISSIIVGIAVNYPLHLISHLGHTSDVRQALHEIAKPLVVGNITTVGAFLALIPLHSPALRDLGLFSSFLLVGTILFTLLWLPHVVSEKGGASTSERIPGDAPARSLPPTATGNSGSWSLYGTLVLLLLTLFLGYHSLGITFDTDLSHINYMTPQQRADMEFLQQLAPADARFDADRSYRLAPSAEEAQQRMRLWQSWTDAHRDSLLTALHDEAVGVGFAEDSFEPFSTLLNTETDDMPTRSLSQGLSLRSLQSALLISLSDDFNYIGWACACIVFFFLWASFRSLPLALLSFLPMAVSWLWILGIMSLLDIHFNIVNIILATFIFGQGDDYTIFMTEGTVYEHTYHRPMLASYRRAILLSALIMFIGIGSLIVARHPALHSLAEVTIVGMSSVVLMAFVIPPMAYRWYVRVRHLKIGNE